MKTLDGYRIWGEGDVFRKKAEGFQRYAAMKEFHRVHERGWRETLNHEPAHPPSMLHPAFINTHLHFCEIQKWGQKVNVVPRDDGMPADVYEHVANRSSGHLEKRGNFLEESSGLAQGQSKTANHGGGLERSVAKGPVMTKGYGTGHTSMTYSLMTHNGDPDGEFGGEITVDDKTQSCPRRKHTWFPLRSR